MRLALHQKIVGNLLGGPLPIAPKTWNDFPRLIFRVKDFQLTDEGR